MNPKKQKKLKKNKKIKSIEKRISEIDTLKKKIEGLGLNSNFKEIDELYKKFD